MGVIRLVGLEAWAHHGVLPHETAGGQRFVVDVALHGDLGPASRSDDLADTVDYGRVAAAVADALVHPTRQLVETVAAQVADAALAVDPRIDAVDVAVHKPGAPVGVPVTDVVVELHRARDRAVDPAP